MNEGLFGDHAIFIWSAYAISLVVLIWTALRPLLRERKLRRMLQLAARHEERNTP